MKILAVAVGGYIITKKGILHKQMIKDLGRVINLQVIPILTLFFLVNIFLFDTLSYYWKCNNECGNRKTQNGINIIWSTYINTCNCLLSGSNLSFGMGNQSGG